MKGLETKEGDKAFPDGLRPFNFQELQELVDTNPLIKILNSETLSATFNNGAWFDKDLFQPIQTVFVKTEDGRKRFILDGYHRTYIAYTRAQERGGETDFPIWVQDVTESHLRNFGTITPENELPELTPEEFAKILILPTKAQPEISQQRFLAALGEFWTHKVGHEFATTHNPLLAFMHLAYPPVAAETDPPPKPFQQGIQSLANIIPSLNYTVDGALIDSVVAAATDREPETNYVTERSRNSVKQLLAYPAIRKKIETSELEMEAASNLLLDNILHKVFQLSQQHTDEKHRKVRFKRFFIDLIDPIFDIDQTISIMNASLPQVRREKILHDIKKENTTAAYLSATGKTRELLTFLEKEIIKQMLPPDDTINHPDISQVIQGVADVTKIVLPPRHLLGRIKELQQSHPRFHKEFEALVPPLMRAETQVIIRSNRETAITELRNVITKTENAIALLLDPRLAEPERDQRREGSASAAQQDRIRKLEQENQQIKEHRRTAQEALAQREHELQTAVAQGRELARQLAAATTQLQKKDAIIAALQEALTETNAAHATPNAEATPPPPPVPTVLFSAAAPELPAKKAEKAAPPEPAAKSDEHEGPAVPKKWYQRPLYDNHQLSRLERDYAKAVADGKADRIPGVTREEVERRNRETIERYYLPTLEENAADSPLLRRSSFVDPATPVDYTEHASGVTDKPMKGWYNTQGFDSNFFTSAQERQCVEAVDTDEVEAYAERAGLTEAMVKRTARKAYERFTRR